MHELSLIADLLRKIELTAADAKAQRVTVVKVRLGALSHLSATHFREHFIAGSQGTIAEGADLVIETGTDTSEPEAQNIVLQSVDVS